MKATVETYQDRAGKWRWKLKHGNGKVLAASSEGFASKANANRNLRAIRTALATLP